MIRDIRGQIKKSEKCFNWLQLNSADYDENKQYPQATIVSQFSSDQSYKEITVVTYSRRTINFLTLK